MRYKYLIGFIVLFFALFLVIQSIDYIVIINNIDSTDIFEPEYDSLQDGLVRAERRFKLGRRLEITAEIKYKYTGENTQPYEVVEIYSSSGSYITPGIIYTPVKQTGEVRWNDETNSYELAYSIDYILTLGFSGEGDKTYGIKRKYTFKDVMEIEPLGEEAQRLIEENIKLPVKAVTYEHIERSLSIEDFAFINRTMGIQDVYDILGEPNGTIGFGVIRDYYVLSDNSVVTIYGDENSMWRVEHCWFDENGNINNVYILDPQTSN